MGTFSVAQSWCAREGLFMRTFPKQLKAIIGSMGIGLAIFGLLAYSLMLYSVTQSIASNGQPMVTTAAR